MFPHILGYITSSTEGSIKLILMFLDERLDHTMVDDH